MNKFASTKMAKINKGWGNSENGSNNNKIENKGFMLRNPIKCY